MPTKSEVPNKDLAMADAERSVSDLLSTFYDVDDLQNADTHVKEGALDYKYQESTDDDIFSGALFSREDFDLDKCLDTVLTKYSMVDLIALLRRMEREVRQFTAGKQLLIYDNYECLFTALDTVHEINDELTVVQKHLHALKTSQIKASSIDISSNYGIREKLLRISDLNHVYNVFQALVSIASCLRESKQMISRGDTDKKGLLEVLEIVSKTHVILDVLKEKAGPKAQRIQLFHTFRKYVKALIPAVIKGLDRLLRDEYFSHDELINICSKLALSHMRGHQVLEYYWLNKSLLFRKRLERIMEAVSVSTVTLYTLSNEIIDLLVFLVEAIHSDGYSNLTKSVEASNSTQEVSNHMTMQETDECCIFCGDYDAEVMFENGDKNCRTITRDGAPSDDAESAIYSYYRVKKSSAHKCTCVKNNMAYQIISSYAQLAFALLQHRLASRPKSFNANELIFVLTGILDRIKNIRKEDAIVRCIIDISCKWMFLIVLLYVQKLFYPVYDAWADTILLTGDNKDHTNVNRIVDVVESILKDQITDLMDFVDDLTAVVHISLRPVFSSFVMLYIIYLKHVSRAIFKRIVTTIMWKQQIDYLASVASLITVRESSGHMRETLVSEHTNITRESIRQAMAGHNILPRDDDGCQTELAETKKGLSVDYYVECMLTGKTRNWYSTEGAMRSSLPRISASVYRFNDLFGKILKKAAEQLGRESTIVTSGDLQIMPQLAYAPSQSCITFKQSVYTVNCLKYVPAKNYIEGIFGTQSKQFTCMLYAMHKLGKEGCFTGSVPFVTIPEDINNKEREHFLQEGMVEVDSLHLAQSIQSHVMCGYITIANTLIRTTMEYMEEDAIMAETTIKDFTGMMYDMIEFLNATTDAALADVTTQAKITEMQKKLNDVIGCNNMTAINSIYEFPFLPSKEYCLKLFTIRIAQYISGIAKQHVISGKQLTEILSRIEMHLLVAFRKSADVDQMKRVFGQLAYPDVM